MKKLNLFLMKCSILLKLKNIKRIKEWNEITAEITTDGWNDGEGGTFKKEDDAGKVALEKAKEYGKI